MNKIVPLLICGFLCLWQGGAWAENTQQDEIIYRTNLGRSDDVKLLLDNGASPNQTNDDGVPLLALASQRKDKEGINVVKTLIAGGANINAADHQGETALFYAARQDNVEIVNYLLNNNINYYAIDHHGDIARNIAHASGHDDIVVLMDNFVKTQAQQVQLQYAQAEKAMQQQYQEQLAKNKEASETLNQQVKQVNSQIAAMNEQQKKAAESAAPQPELISTPAPAKPLPTSSLQSDRLPPLSEPESVLPPHASPTLDEYEAETKSAKPADATPSTPAPLPAAPAAANETSKTIVVPSTAIVATGPSNDEIIARRNSPQFQTDIYNFAFNSCAYQYWSFIQQAKQSSEMSDEETEIAIDSHKDQINSQITHLDDTYKLDKNYTSRVSDNVKHRIFDQLSQMPSNTYRHEQGVGKMDDMKKRCEVISHSWERQPDPAPPKKDDKDEYKGSGLGAVSSHGKSSSTGHYSTGGGGGGGKASGGSKASGGGGNSGKGGKEHGGHKKEKQNAAPSGF